MPDEKTYTAEDFAHAEFARHPNGRIAHRCGPDTWQTTVPMEPWTTWWGADADMARDGWVPVTEQKITVTNEMLSAAVAANYTPAEQSGIYGYMRHVITAALDAAPTTDPAHDIDWQEVAERHEDTIKALVAERDEAEHEFRVSEKLRRDIDPGPVLDEVARLDGELYDMRARAEQAEAERDAARSYAEELACAVKSRDGVIKVRTAERDEMRAMTARELLTAAWAAAYVPEDGIIPAGAEYVSRDRESGFLRGPLTSGFAHCERRLLDPPAPKRPEGAEQLEGLMIDHADDWDGDWDTLADFLASRGVRVTTEGDPR